MTGGQGAGGALAMDAQQPPFVPDVVPLELGEVVRHVVDQVELCAPGGPLERPPGRVREQLAVRPGDCFRIVVLNVRGLAVVLAASRAPGLWDAANTKFTDPAGRPSIPGILNGPSTGVL